MRKIVCITGFLFYCLSAYADPGYTVGVSGPTSFCQGGGITLTATGAPAGATFQWTKNNSNIGGATASTYVLTNAVVSAGGAYSVIVDTGNGGPVIHYDTINIVVNPKPTASFTFAPNNTCISTPVNFTNTSSGVGLTYSWNFGDPNSGTGNTSTVQHPTHRFVGSPGTAPQNFDVRLIVTSSAGCKDTFNTNVTISQSPGTQLMGTGYTAPNTFKSCGSSATVFTFINNSSTLSTNTGYRIIWGDGSPDYTSSSNTNWSTTHSFGVGSHPISFIVTGAGGCIDTATYYVFVGTNPAVALGNPGNTSICSGDSLTFPISNISSNAPGTQYTITFNDGYTVSYIHPDPPGTPPSSVTHTFTTTSCGTNSSNGSQTFTNSYSGTITASNPCGTSSGSVVPIYVSSKPLASMTISPRDTVCVNSNVTMSSTSPLNQSVDPGTGSCTPGKNIWSITPSAGFTVTSGSLGNTFGLGDPSAWINGSATIALNFTSTGTYTIKLITGNNAICKLDTAIRTICVNPQPTSPFLIDNNAGCTPVDVTTTNNSNSPICGANSYTWSVAYSNAQACAPNSSNYTITGGSLTSFQPSFQFINPGVYTISLVTRNSSGACVSPATTQQVTVKSKPTVSIAAVGPICQNQSVTPVATVNNCYSSVAATYAWTLQNGSPASSTSLNPGPVIYSVSGTHNITLDVTNECGVTQATRTIQVNPRPDLTVPANQVFCTGDVTGTLSFSSGLAGTTFSWVNNNTGIGLAASGSGNINSFTTANATANPIIATITVTALNGTCSNTTTFTITVNPRPPLPGVTTPVTYCQNDPASQLTATVAAGHTLLWYTTASGGVGNATAPTPGTAVVGSTNYYVSQVNNTTNCEGNRALITVTVKAIPVIGAASGANPTTCGGTNGSISLTGLTAGSVYSVSYVKNGGAPATVSLTANGSGTVIIGSLSTGIYSNITVTLAGCPSAAAGPITLSDPNPPATPTATANTPLCSGSTLTLGATTIPGASYTWVGQNGFTSTQQNPSINNIITAAAGIYSVTVTVAGCSSGAGTVNVVIDSTPAVPTAGSNSPLCSGNDILLTANSATAGISYSWTGPGGFTSNQQNPIISSATTAATGSYIVTATLGNCSSPRSLSITVNPTPVIGTSSASDPATCNSSSGSITLNGLAASTNYTVSYIKNGGVPTTVAIMSSAAGNVVIANLGAGTYTNVFVTLNGCSSAAVGPFTLADPNPPTQPVATANTPICSGNTLTLGASTTSPGTATYSWTGPNSFTSALQNPVINNISTAGTGTYNVTVTINGCTSAPSGVGVTVNPTPATPTAGSNSPVCTGNTLTLTSNSTTAGVNYSWTGPNSFSSSIQNPSISNVSAAAGGLYTVTTTLGLCSSSAGTTVAINPTPVIGGSSFTDPTTCASSTGTITLTGLTANAIYNVSYVKNGGAPTIVNNVAANASGNLVITGLTAGTYTNVFVILNGCPSSAVGLFTLSDPNPPATPTASSNSPICSGNTVSLNASSASSGTITYSWTGPNGFTSTQQNPTILSATTAATGTYNVTATLNGCVSAAQPVPVVVHQTPAMPVASANSPVCEGGIISFTATTTYVGPVTWAWTGPNGFANTTQNPSIANVTTAATGTYNVIATATTGNCSSLPGGVPVVVNPTPVISSSSFTNPTQCSSSTGTIVLNGLAANTTYTVTYTKNGNPVTATITSNAGGTLTILNLAAGTYANIKVTTLAGCPSNNAGPHILSDPNPPATPVAGSNSPICTGSTLTLTASTTTAGSIVYAWTGPGGFTSGVQNPSILNAQPSQSGWYYVSATLNNCRSLQDSVLVSIASSPAGPAVSSPVNYCIGAPSVPLTATPQPGNTLRWYTQAVGGTFTTTAPTPSTAVTGTTNYYVSQVTALGCEGARSQVQVIVNPDATAQYNYSPSTACAPFNINSSVIQPVLYPTRNGTYQWYANGVLIGTGTSFPGYTISLAGDSVLIKLKTTSLFGCKNDSTEHWFYTTPKPVTNFTASDTVGCGPLPVTFTNTTPLPSQFSFLWNFGNGITSTATNPGTIVFQPNPNAGDTTYHVKLTAFTVCDTIVKIVDVRVKSKPKALIVPSTTYGCSPLPVTFNNVSSGVNMTYKWDFGDGSPLVTTNNNSPVQHTYHTGQQDTFYVKLMASNECGTDTAVYAIVVAARTISLNVTVNGNELTGCAPHTVRFINNSAGATNFVWSFGDGNILSTIKNIDTVTHTYIATGTFTATIRASNGCTDTTGSITVRVFRKPIPDFSVNPLPACIGDTLQFTNQTDTATSLLWNFGNGVTSQLTNPQYAYTTANTYDVKLIAVRQYGPGNACSDSITKTVTVVASLPGSFSVSASAGTCIPFTVVFTNQSLPSSLTTWNFGNGVLDTGNVVTHTYTQAGIFNVTMTARDLGGCRYVANKQITVNGPAGSFIYDHGYICGNTPVRFEGTVTGTDSIRWNFGDGDSITTINNIVYHLYNNPGNYVPTARLLAGAGCSKLLQGVDTIKVDYVDAGFKFNAVRVCASTSVSFTDTSRTYFGLQSWQWNFGDGNTSTLRNPVHTYNTTNTWPVQLIVQGISGCADTVNVPVFVKVDSKPIANIDAPPTGCVNQPVLYTAIVTSPDPVTYYSWVFSNGATGNTPTVNNNYAAGGPYNATLIIGTSFGCYDTVSQPITINPSPFVTTNVDMQICRGQSAQLNATGGLSYQWAPFTGLSCNTCPNPIASPLVTTQYVVTGYNSFGCAGRDTILITVPPPIDVIATANTVMCIGDSVQLNATGAATYTWSPATGLSCANCPAPLATPAVTTVYRVIGKDAYNCFQDTAYVTIGVGNYPVVNVGPDKILATGTEFALTPTATNGPIALWTWTPANDLSCASCPSPVVTAKKDICYTVTATNFFGCSGKDTMCIKVFCESSQLFVPNAFTPDGDGINDLLVVRAKGVKLVKSFRIFNRWGQVVFERSNFTPNSDTYGWNGKVNDIAAPPDVYVYTCEVVCEDGTPYTYKGNVAIIK
jgi:large repetitive protein